VPLKADYQLYKLLREAIPCLDTAINKLVLLVGIPDIVADEPLKTDIDNWLQTVKVNHLQRGFSSFLSNHIDSLLWSGKAVAEMVPNNAGNELWALHNLESESIVYREQPGEPLMLNVCQRQMSSAEPVMLDPAWTVVNLYNPGTNPHGTSLFRSLPFVSEILATMEQALRQTWERFGSPTFRVSWTPPEGWSDPSGTKTAAIMAGIEDNFVSAMEARKEGKVRDFFAAGVEVSVLGADGQVLQFREPYEAVMQQIAGRTGLPYWMIGFPWGSTERLSTQQADVLIATLDGIWDELYPDLRFIIETRQNLVGRPGDFEINRAATTLQDAVETARAELMASQGEATRERTATQLWRSGVYTQEQYALHILGEDWDGEIATPMTEPPAAPVPAGGGFGTQLSLAARTCEHKHKAADAQTSIGAGEEPHDPRIADAITGFHGDARGAARDLRQDCWRVLDLPEVNSAGVGLAKADKPFEMTPEQSALMDAAIEKFLSRMAGSQRSKSGFTASDTGDGIIQQWDRFAYSVGATRSAEMTGADTVQTDVGRDSSAVRAMLDRGFDRLSDGGRLRLEGVLDEVHQVITDGISVNLNPLDIARDLSSQFDEYEGWQFERLARTEVAFAQNEGQMEEFRAEGVDMSAAEADPPPWHPNCLCALTIEQRDGNWTGVYDVAATACEICQAYAGGP